MVWKHLFHCLPAPLFVASQLNISMALSSHLSAAHMVYLQVHACSAAAKAAAAAARAASEGEQLINAAPPVAPPPAVPTKVVSPPYTFPDPEGPP